MDIPFLEFKDASKSFGKYEVFKNLNLKIWANSIHFVIGRSGSGKSVLLKHILGFLQLDAGDMYIKGQNIKSFSKLDWINLRMKIGILFQDSALFDSMNVFENVAFPIREHTKYDNIKIEQIVIQKLAMVGLNHHAKKMPSELSGGMRKRVALARAIALEPDLVMFDEPSSGLDPIVSTVVDELIVELQAKLKSTFLIISHDMKATFRIANRVSMLYDGAIIFDGTKEEIKSTPDVLIQQFINGKLDGPFNIFY